MAKILVVDDQESMRSIIASMLTEKGHTVTTAEDGLQALEITKQDNFDLVVADVNMPRLNGLEFIKQVKIPVVFVTGMLEEALQVELEKNPPAGLIIKPFRQPEAMAVIEKVLG